MNLKETIKWKPKTCIRVCLSHQQENFFDIQEALQAIHMRQEMLREQLACAKSKGEETVGRNLQVAITNTCHLNSREAAVILKPKEFIKKWLNLLQW